MKQKRDLEVVCIAKLKITKVYLHVAVHCKFFIGYCFDRHPFYW